MPWSKVPGSETDECADGQIAVIKDEDESVEGCHDTEEDADAQLAALNASEEKEVAGVDTTPPDYMQEAAQTGLGQVDDGMGGEGLERQTVEEARQIANGEALTRNKIEKGDAFYGRNQDQYCPLSEASDAQRTSMNLWGGCDAGSWYSRKNEQIDEAMDESALNSVFTKLESTIEKADVMDLSTGDLVQWDSSGGTAYGRVDEVAMEGSLESSLRDEPMEASEDNPAVRVELVDATDDGIEGRGETVLHRPETLSMASEDDVKAVSAPHVKSSVGARRRLAFETKGLEVKQDDEEEFRFEGYGAVFGNKDRGGDIIEPGAFKQTINRNDGTFPLVADHDLKLKSRVGVVYAEEDQHGVKVDAHVNTEKRLGREVASDIRHSQKHGETIGMSFGYEVKKDDYDKEKDARLLKEIKTYEFSLTQIPMNPQAGVTGVKGFLDDDAALQTLARKIAPILARETDLISRLKAQVFGDDSASDSPDGPSDAELVETLTSLKSELEANG